MSYSIRTEPAGHQFSAEPAQTILAAALARGVGLPYGCRSGACGSCSALLTEGCVAYPEGPPPALAGQPDAVCITCRAVPCSDLVLRVAELPAVADLPPRILPVRVVHKTLLSHDVLLLRLKPPAGPPLRWLPGQYLEFLLADGRRRAFSIANAPADEGLLELHVRRVPGGSFTEYLFETVAERAILRIQLPLGTFVLRDSPRPVLLVAGGTGFAPIKAMLEQAFRDGPTRRFALYWGVRARCDLYLPALPADWLAAHGEFRYVPVLSQPDPDWRGRCGWVHEAVLADHVQLGGFDVYVSGPPPMVEAARRAFPLRGLPLTQLFSDAFEFGADRQAGSGTQEAGG